MIRNKQNAESVVLLHECMHRDFYNTHLLRVISHMQGVIHILDNAKMSIFDTLPPSYNVI